MSLHITWNLVVLSLNLIDIYLVTELLVFIVLQLFTKEKAKLGEKNNSNSLNVLQIGVM